MSPRLILLNALLLAVAGYFSFALMHELDGRRPLPGQPVARAPQAPPAADAAPGEATARPDPRAQYGIIATRSLFSPSRTEAPGTSEASAQPAALRPVLHGVVLDDAKSRAFLEEAATKRVFGYAVGDTVGGGRLEAIRADRVVIARPEGALEVMLRDPSKPPPPAPTAAAPPQAPAAGTPVPPIRPPAGSSPAPGRPALGTPAPPPGPGQPVTAPPRPLQSIPRDSLRRPTVTPPDESGG